jgi:MYXO-CTERM domain-containing protein
LLRSNRSPGLASLFVLAGLALAAPRAFAFQAPGRAAPYTATTAPAVSSGGLEAAPGQPAIPPAPDATWGAAPASRRAAFARFEQAHGAGWQALWDRATDAPLRVLGRGIPAPGSIADAASAEAFARAFLVANADLLAPGVPAARFVLVANDLDHGLRTVAFEQRAAVVGLASVPVVGGRFSVRFKNDRLFVFASEAIASGVTLAPPRVSRAAAELAARAWTAQLHGVTALGEATSLAAFPVARAGGSALHLAYRVVIEADAPRARYVVFVDAARGAPLAREQTLRFAAASVQFDAPVRAPQLGRASYPAPRLSLAVDGVPGASDLAGMFTWDAGAPGSLSLDATGALVGVTSVASPAVAATFAAVDGQPVLWSLAEDEQGDAQLAAYIHASLVKAHAAVIAPTMSFLDAQLQVIVNEPDAQGCNAFWDGGATNFLLQNAGCNNTARLADVVYHEFGHAFHQHAIIAGTGALDAALGEGTGDIMTSSVTHDYHLAPGFYLASDTPLRDLSSGRRWPDDISADPHETGLIWAGAMWDLRTFLVEDLGEAAGHALTDQLFYQAIRRASSVPTTYAEVLAADDDDGDLSNGTPHICAINRAFVAHGLAPVLDASGRVLHHTPLTSLSPQASSYPIDVTTEVLYPQCASTKVDSVHVVWRAVGDNSPTKVSLALGADGHYTGVIPASPENTQLRYKVVAQAAEASLSLPDNRADDTYAAFVGTTRVLYENDFEAQIDGWTFGGSPNGPGDFEWGAPAGLGGDPAAAFSGSKVLGDRLAGTGLYKPVRTVFADSPVIDLQGEENVRLQLRRWLTVQDSFFDQASIYVNGALIWQNDGTDEDDGTLDHRDREWRFEDIDLRPRLNGATTAQIRFEIVADGAKQRGGFTLDDVRIVAFRPTPMSPPVPPVPEPAPPPIVVTPEPDLSLAGGCACGIAGGAPGSSLPALGALVALGLIGRRRRR